MPDAESPDRSERPWSRQWWEHHAVVMMVWLNIAAGLGSFLPDTWWGNAINVVSVAIMAAALLMFYSHMRYMCIRCVIESPADAPAAANRKRYWLRLRHTANESWMFIAFIVVAFAFVAINRELPHTPSVVDHITGLVVTLPFAAMWYSNRVHRGLVVWCPWCNGRGKPETVPEPTPDPVVSKTT